MRRWGPEANSAGTGHCKGQVNCSLSSVYFRKIEQCQDTTCPVGKANTLIFKNRDRSSMCEGFCYFGNDPLFLTRIQWCRYEMIYRPYNQSGYNIFIIILGM